MRRARVLIAQENTRWAVPNPHVVVEEVSRITNLKEALSKRKPAVLVVALDLPGLGGATGLGQLRELSPATKIIAVARRSSEREEVEVLRTGAKGYVSRTLPETMLSKAIEKVQEGEIWAGRRAIGALLEEVFGSSMRTGATEQARSKLASRLETLTVRENEIVRLLRNGASNKEIASALNVSVSTVKAHLTSIFRKLDQPDRLRLALFLSDSIRDQH
jgi:two-component system, NarL family, nitrate/nitrite response regulator NarL